MALPSPSNEDQGVPVPRCPKGTYDNPFPESNVGVSSTLHSLCPGLGSASDPAGRTHRFQPTLHPDLMVWGTLVHPQTHIALVSKGSSTGLLTTEPWTSCQKAPLCIAQYVPAPPDPHGCPWWSHGRSRRVVNMGCVPPLGQETSTPQGEGSPVPRRHVSQLPLSGDVGCGDPTLLGQCILQTRSWDMQDPGGTKTEARSV